MDTTAPTPAPESAPDLTESLATRFYRDASVGVLGHPIVAAVIGLLVRGDTGDLPAIIVFAVISTATLIRVMLHRSSLRLHSDPPALARRLRMATAAGASGWIFVSVYLFPQVEPEVLGRILVAYAGLVAAGVATHQSDRRGFHIFTGFLLGSAILGSVLTGNPLAAIDTMFILAFWATMTVIHSRIHKQLQARLAAGLQLQNAIERTTREKEFVNAVLAGAPDGMAVVTPDGRLDRASNEFVRLVGMSADELKNLDPTEHRGDPFWDTLREVTEHARRDGRSTREAEVTDEGRRRWFQLSAATGQGAATGWVVVLVEDFTPLRAAEAAREAAEESYSDLVESAHDLIWKIDTQGNWTFLNTAALDIYGVPPIDLIGTNVFERALPEHREADLKVFQRLMDGYEFVDQETVHRSDSGEDRVLSFSARPLREGGEIVGAQGVARDVTERKIAARRMKQMAEEAARATQMKSAFLANMSHEIRTPMNGVLGMTELMLDTELSEEQRQYLEVVQSSGQNLLRILNDVLDFSKIEAGHLELEAISFGLHRELGDSVRVLGPVAGKRANELVLDVGPAVPEYILGDPGRLRQIVTNLVSNAIKFTENGEVAVVARRMPGERLRIEVRDTGVGIPADKLESVFQEFSQADTSVTRKFGGTGLGLTISRRLVEMMGGRIGVESSVDVGSTFWFEIPCEISEPPASVGEIPANPDLGGMRIVVVDDNATNRRIIASVLQDAGADVSGAMSAREGMALLDGLADQGTPASMIVSDVQMPNVDGITFLERVRRGRHATVPVVILTSTNDASDARRARALGVQGYHLKPMPRRDLLGAVAKARVAPVQTPDWDAIAEAVEAEVATATTPERPPEPGTGPHVLVAEDNPVNRQVAGATLRQGGFRVTMVENGALAVEAVSTGDFAAVLMDVQMPVMDGVEAARVIRSEPWGREIPIIALTAHALDEERKRCLDAGMSDFLSKPFRPAELVRRLTTWIEGDPDELAAMGVALPVPDDSTPAADEDGAPPVDLDGLREAMEIAGIGEIVDTMLQLFLDEIDERRATIADSVETMSYQGVVESAHSLKSSSGNIHAKVLFEGLRELENAGRLEEDETIQSLAIEVLAEIDRVTTYLRGIELG